MEGKDGQKNQKDSKGNQRRCFDCNSDTHMKGNSRCPKSNRFNAPRRKGKGKSGAYLGEEDFYERKDLEWDPKEEDNYQEIEEDDDDLHSSKDNDEDQVHFASAYMAHLPCNKSIDEEIEDLLNITQESAQSIETTFMALSEQSDDDIIADYEEEKNEQE